MVKGSSHFLKDLAKNFYYKLFLIRNWLGSGYWLLQKIIFGIFIVSSFTQLVLNLAGGATRYQEFQKFRGALTWWLAILASTTVIWVLGRAILNLDLYIYYRIFIPLRKAAPRVFGGRVDKRIGDILDSHLYQTWKPCFIKREHLMRKSYWPNWVFSIVMIFGAGKVAQVIRGEKKDKRWILKVDLRNESYGIYNNCGKRFLQERFRRAATSPEILKRSEEFHRFMLPSSHSGTQWVWGDVGETVPLRWASGGFLPIVSYNGRPWALLFFRDIPPIGLNVANGASEDKEEYKDLHHLIGREFSEETIILNARPQLGAELYKQTFQSFSPHLQSKSIMAQYLNPSFSKKHAELRYEHDGIRIETHEHFKRDIQIIPTPFEVSVTYHQPDLRTVGEESIRNVVYCLNPAEFGIEVIWLCTFKLNDGEDIVDGEYHLSRKVLIRQPVILLDMNFLRELYKRQRSLGELQSSDDCRDGKLLPPIPTRHCKIFDADIPLRRHRLDELSKQENDPLISKKAKENIVWERKRIESWLSQYEGAFAEAKEKGLQHEHLRILCPVTWKTLEIIFAHNIEYRGK